MRYVGQSYEVDTPIPDGDLTVSSLPEIEQAFHAAHMREFGVSSDDFDPAFVSFGVTAIGVMESPPPMDMGHATEGDAIKTIRDVYFDGDWMQCSVYDGEVLGPKHEIDGPAIIEYEHACTVMPPNTHGRVNEMGALIITLEC